MACALGPAPDGRHAGGAVGSVSVRPCAPPAWRQVRHAARAGSAAARGVPPAVAATIGSGLLLGGGLSVLLGV